MNGLLFNLKDKVIVITGGYGILASTIVKYLVREGARVIILGRSEVKAKKLIDEVGVAAGTLTFLVSDVLNQELLEQNRTDIMARFGRIDVLINAAGGNISGATIAPDKTLFDLNVEAFKEVTDLNLLGTVLPSITFAKAMVDSGAGNIINIASVSALRPLTRVVGYGVAKAAIANFTKSLAGELAIKFGDKFRVNALVPGFFITEQNKSLLTNQDGSYTDRAKTILTHTPFGRFGKPEELLGAIHYLASDASSFVSGTLLIVDGGFDSFAI